MSVRLPSIHVPPHFRAWIAQSDARVAITGATGWIGTDLAHLSSDLGLDQASGRLRLFGSSDRTVQSGTQSFVIEDLANATPLGSGRWIVFHLAFLGKERTEDLPVNEFERINNLVLQQTRLLAETAEHLRFVFSSSGAVYGPDRQMVDHTGNAYGYMKVRHETEIRDWAETRSVPMINTRIFNIGGPHINKQTYYALSDFIAQVRRTERIQIGASKPVFRSFVHVRELSYVLFEAVLAPDLGYQSFDTCGREVVEINDLARSVGRVLGFDNLTIERPAILPQSQSDWYVGDARFYQTLLAKSEMKPIGLDEIIRTSAEFMGVQ